MSAKRPSPDADPTPWRSSGKGSAPVVAICGGIGGAKLALGLYRVLEPETLTVVINTGDDFEHLGVHVSPDVDTVTYTLAGINNSETGWGRRNETWTFMSALEELGGETWFSLGDGDLALNIERTRRLKNGESLSEVTDFFRKRLGISARLLPMSDDPVHTVVDTTEGPLPFQHYFVRERCRPVVKEIRFDGAEGASPSEAAIEALRTATLRAVVICPSNPYLSIDPILSVPGFRQALAQCEAPVVAVSPIIGGRAVKGPTTKIMDELSIPVHAAAICAHYVDFLDGCLIDHADEGEASEIPISCHITRTLMKTLSERDNLARETLTFADSLRRKASSGEPASSISGETD